MVVCDSSPGKLTGPRQPCEVNEILAPTVRWGAEAQRSQVAEVAHLATAGPGQPHPISSPEGGDLGGKDAVNKSLASSSVGTHSSEDPDLVPAHPPEGQPAGS